MSRNFSVNRRRANLVDLLLPLNENTVGYEFFYASNFDGSYTSIATVPSSGLSSPTVASVPDVPGQYRGYTRFMFNPVDYTIDDKKPFFLKTKSYSKVGADVSDTSHHLILPYNTTPNRSVTIHGSVGASDTNILLPQQCSNFLFQVKTGNLLVELDPGGGYFLAPNLTTYGFDWAMAFPASDQMTVKSDTTTSEFYASMRLVNSQTL